MGLFGFGKKKSAANEEVAEAKEEVQAKEITKVSEETKATSDTKTEVKVEVPEKKADAIDDGNEGQISSIKLNVIDSEQQMINRLMKGAGNVIAMLKGVLAGKNGTDMFIVTVYAAGLAGIACHEAVKATSGAFEVIECKNGKKYFMGDALNKFLHEDKYSVTGGCRAITEAPKEALLALITNQTKTLGSDEFKLGGNMDPVDVYKQVKSCWDGIYNNITVKYCEKPEEWPVLYGIVLQNIMSESLKLVSKEALFNTAVDVACGLSKMDSESL